MTLGLMSPSPLPGRECCQQNFQSCFISPCSHSAVSPPSFLGASQHVPVTSVGTLGWAEPAAARTCWHSQGAGDGDKLTSPTLCLHRASSSVCHGPCTIWLFKFLSSHSAIKLQLCWFFRDKEGHRRRSQRRHVSP